MIHNRIWVIRLPIFFFFLLLEIFKANWQFLKWVLWARQWYCLVMVHPCQIRHPLGRHLLALSISMTPGTVAVDLSSEGILIHALMSRDPQQLSRSIFEGLEKKIMWVFGEVQS